MTTESNKRIFAQTNFNWISTQFELEPIWKSSIQINKKLREMERLLLDEMPYRVLAPLLL